MVGNISLLLYSYYSNMELLSIEILRYSLVHLKFYLVWFCIFFIYCTILPAPWSVLPCQYILYPSITVSHLLSSFYQVSVMAIILIFSFNSRHLSSPILLFRHLLLVYKHLKMLSLFSCVALHDVIEWDSFIWLLLIRSCLCFVIFHSLFLIRTYRICINRSSL